MNTLRACSSLNLRTSFSVRAFSRPFFCNLASCFLVNNPSFLSSSIALIGLTPEPLRARTIGHNSIHVLGLLWRFQKCESENSEQQQSIDSQFPSKLLQFARKNQPAETLT